MSYAGLSMKVFLSVNIVENFRDNPKDHIWIFMYIYLPIDHWLLKHLDQNLS